MMSASVEPRPTRAIRSRGFTLLEVVVVLVIASLVSVVLIQGLGMVLNVRDNFSERMFELDSAALTRSRITTPLEGLVADFDGGENTFSGTPTSVSGLTLMPLLRRGGRPIPFSLSIEYDAGSETNTILYQEDEDDPMVIATWTGEQADFKFIADASGWVESWPPDAPPMFVSNQVVITDLRPSQLPQLILLDTRSDTEPVFAVAVQARRNRIPRDPIF